MKLIKTEDAVGQVICHDMTQIIKGVMKDAVFRKGHVIRECDIPVLLSIGKDNIYVWENDESMMHENEAAELLCTICKGANISRGEVKEGKIELSAECDGLLKIDREKLRVINSFGQMMIATRHGDFPVKKGDRIAGTRIIPLVIEREKMEEIRWLCGEEPILNIIPFPSRRVGIVTTGNEVFHGRIEDTFTPVVVEKLEEFGYSLCGHETVNDDSENIEKAIKKLLDGGTEMIVCTGGMSVDPDDKTPLAIRNICGSVVTYGAPVLPGAMFLLAYYGEEKIPVLGLPGCVMYAKRTIFDIVLPRIAAGEILMPDDFAMLGEGGLCLNCNICTYPNCGFGKGGY
ncbi:MAG: molybdopterin-binding protein [Mogibacterium sp.]|nr:molybdopterin-binding protein [Mogibacterium sp.]